MSSRLPARRRIPARAIVASLAGAAVVTASVVPAYAAGPAVTCQYTVTTWSGGFMAELAVANAGPAINGWTVHWTFPVPTQATAVWSANLTQPSPLEAVATPAFWNQVIPTGATRSFGWTAAAPRTDVPTDITVNGQRC